MIIRSEQIITYSAVFAITAGVGMISQWTALILLKRIPEFVDEPVRISFHIAAEMATALCLIIGGVGLLTDPDWGKPLHLVSLGMIFYTSIVSPGYFAQLGNWKWLGLFSVLIGLGLISLLLVA